MTDVALLRRIVSAAAAVARDPAIVAPLAASTGLSPEGVRLALAEHLELDVTDAELEKLVYDARPVARVHVILSANVFVAPLRALVLARAASARVTVRPSRREPVFAHALVDTLADAGVTIEDRSVAAISEGEIHVYGRDATIADVTKQARVPVVGHGAGMGVAFVPASADLEALALALARDVVPFDQRGCLSPRVAFVEEGSRAFAKLLSRALDRASESVPRGMLFEDERAEATRYADTLAFAGVLERGASSLVGHAETLLVPPPGRHVHVMPWNEAALASIGRFVVTVGSLTEDDARRIAPAHARAAVLGEMQRPRLDGPVDRR